MQLKQGWKKSQGRKNFYCEEAESISPVIEWQNY